MRKYYLKQKAIAVRASYTIYDENEQALYTCKAKMFSPRGTVEIFDASTQSHLFTMQRKLFSFMPVHYLIDQQGNTVATMRQRFAVRRQRVEIESSYGTYQVDGDLWAHNFLIRETGEEVIYVKKKFLSWGDSYEITILSDKNIEFLLALTIMIDRKFHTSKRGK